MSLPKVVREAKLWSLMPRDRIWPLGVTRRHRAIQGSALELANLANPGVILDIPFNPSLESIVNLNNELKPGQCVLVGIDLNQGIIISLEGRLGTNDSPYDADMSVYDLNTPRWLGIEHEEATKSSFSRVCQEHFGVYDEKNQQHIDLGNELIDDVVDAVNEAKAVGSVLVHRTSWSDAQAMLAIVLATQIGVSVSTV